MAILTQTELERHLWGAADILRGTVDAGDYKQYIFGLLFYKRLCDVWDEEFEALLAETGDREEAADPDEHRFHIPKEHRWEAVRQQSTLIGQRLNNALAAIEDANLRLRGVFGSVDFANQDRFSDALLEKLLSHFEKHRLRNADAPADMLGDAYLYLIKMFAEGAGKKGGEFYTPRSIVRLMVEIIDPRPGMSVYDPTCGSGGMLLEAVQYLKDRGEDARTLSLYGQEKNFATWGIAEINLFLHNVDDAFIAKGDTILSPKRYDPKAREFVEGIGAYDRVLANPPFSEKVWGYEVWQNGDPFGRDTYGCPPKGYGDLAFVQHMLASLKDDGMLAVVVPHGVLFRGGAEGRIREAMLAADVVEAVVGLAPNLFYGAGIPAALLVCRKRKPAERRGKVLIVNGDATYQPGKAQNFLTDEHVRTLAETVHAFADVEKLARVVPVEEIAANGHNLNISRYVQTGADAEAVDVAAEVAKLQDLIAKRNEAEAVMLSHLSGLALPDEVVSFAVDQELPERWRETRLGAALAKSEGGGTPPRDVEEYWNGNIPWASVKDVVKGEGFTPEETITEVGLANSTSKLIAAGTNIFAARMGVGAVVRYPFPVAINQDLMALTPSSELDPCFLFYWLQAQKEAFVAVATGTTVKGIRKALLLSFPMLLPPISEQSRIAEVLTSVDTAIAASAKLVGTGGNGSVGALMHLKKALMSDLLSGRVRVPA